ncbi:MAG TPA: type II toxin-antitoxin system RelE/ParE family toxin [Xanthobacteraceae bacterium]|nr:type II toxin-antitoxin system RelE/ParE family toxin [Xanthobacteraceae bacterium]
MRVRYTPRARDDLDAIHSYIKDQSPAAAAAVLKRIRTRIDRLADFPFMAPMTELEGIRGLSIGRYPYKAYYRVVDDEVVILHVRDTRRAPWTGEN